MEMGITTNIECNVQVPGETVLEAKLFGSMVSRMPSGTVSVELNNEGMAIISGGVAEFEIPAMRERLPQPAQHGSRKYHDHSDFDDARADRKDHLCGRCGR